MRGCFQTWSASNLIWGASKHGGVSKHGFGGGASWIWRAKCGVLLTEFRVLPNVGLNFGVASIPGVLPSGVLPKHRETPCSVIEVTTPRHNLTLSILVPYVGGFYEILPRMVF